MEDGITYKTILGYYIIKLSSKKQREKKYFKISLCLVSLAKICLTCYNKTNFTVSQMAGADFDSFRDKFTRWWWWWVRGVTVNSQYLNDLMQNVLTLVIISSRWINKTKKQIIFYYCVYIFKPIGFSLVAEYIMEKAS